MMNTPSAVYAAEGERTSEGVRVGWLPRAIISGFIASVMMLFTYLVGYGFAYAMSGVQFARLRGGSDLAAAFHNLVNNPVVDLARNNLYLALAVYIAGGLIWAAIFARYFEPRLGGPTWRRGVIFSLVPFLFSLFVFLPLVGGGILGVNLNAGPLPLIGNLILHLVYGATLGLVYGPYGDTIQAVEGDDVDAPIERRALQHSERSAANWLVGGLVVGGLAGLVGALLTEGALTADAIKFVVSTALIAGAFGALIGSFAGLSVPSEV